MQTIHSLALANSRSAVLDKGFSRFCDDDDDDDDGDDGEEEVEEGGIKSTSRRPLILFSKSLSRCLQDRAVHFIMCWHIIAKESTPAVNVLL